MRWLTYLRSGKINNRLLCEIATNEKFEKLMADAEIYVDGIATMRFTDLNASLADARSAILAEHPEAAGDRILQTLEAAQIDEEDFSAMSHIRRGTLSCAISEKPMRATRRARRKKHRHALCKRKYFGSHVHLEINWINLHTSFVSNSG